MIYSPSRGGTETWLECPRKWDLAKRWKPIVPWRPEMLLGTAIHAGLAEYYRGGAEPEIVLGATLLKDWQQDTPTLTLETAHVMAVGAYQAARTLDVVGQGTVVAVEQAMGEEQCHPDLVLQHGGTLSVVDWKFTMSCPPEYVAKRLREYETSWQLWHYAWRVQQEFLPMLVTHFTVVLMIGTPRPHAKRIEVPVSQEALVAWEVGAGRVWWLMHAMDRQEPGGAGDNGYMPLMGPWPNYKSCLNYGGCPFYIACHQLAADESKFEGVYTRV